MPAGSELPSCLCHPGSLHCQHGCRWDLLDCLQARRDKVTENAGLLREVADLRREQKGLRHELGHKQQELRQLEFAFDEYKRQVRCLGFKYGAQVSLRPCIRAACRVHGLPLGRVCANCITWNRSRPQQEKLRLLGHA